jgi:PIN domain nuclease of toxin-antitoxin system
VECGVTALVIDTHVLHWWSAEPSRVSNRAAAEMSAADELVVADISWYELARLARSERIVVSVPIGSWLQRLARLVRTVPISVEIATTAASLPALFPGDPADRLIYATAVENGWRLVSKDQALRDYRHPTQIVIW